MIKAKEEADGIVFEYQFSDSSLPFNGGIMDKELAVICALIHVEGIIKEYNEKVITLSHNNVRMKFWQEVKQELNKMIFLLKI